MEEKLDVIRTYAHEQLGGLSKLTIIHADHKYAVANYLGASLLVFQDKSGNLSSVQMGWHAAAAIAEELVKAA